MAWLCATPATQITEPFDYGLAFGPGTSREIVDAFSLSIQQNREDGTIQEWGDTYLLSDSPCLALNDNTEDIAQLSFKQVYGLWVMIAVSVGLGVIFLGGKRVYVMTLLFGPSLTLARRPRLTRRAFHSFVVQAQVAQES